MNFSAMIFPKHQAIPCVISNPWLSPRPSKSAHTGQGHMLPVRHSLLHQAGPSQQPLHQPQHALPQATSSRPAAGSTCRSSLSPASPSGSAAALLPLHPAQHTSPACSTTHPACHGSSRGSSILTRAAGRGGSSSSGGRRSGRGGSSDDFSSSSAWQDRLYSSGAPADSSSGRPAGSSRKPQSGGRGGSSGRKGSSPREQQPKSRDRGGGGSSSSSAADAGGDFVVIKKASASASSGGGYIPTSQEQQDQEALLDGSRFWEAALVDFDEDEDEGDEDELGEGGEWEEGLGDGLGYLDGGEGEEEEVQVEEVVSLLRELAAGLGDEEDEEDEEEGDSSSSSSSSSGQPGRVAAGGAAGAGLRWRQTYLGSEQPPLSLGPVALKQAAGKAGRGLYTSEAVKAGQLLLVAAPLVLLYSEQGTTPENEELAEHLAAAVAATAAGAAGSSGSSKGLAPWQQSALLQLRGPGGVAAASSQQQQQQQGLSELRQLLGPPEEPVQLLGSSDSRLQQQDPPQQQQQQQQQQQLPSAAELLQIVFANCTGEEFEDPALVLLRGATSCGHLGVWPAASLINHACAPNCTAMLLGDRLVVRAARDLPAGSELTLSYLGPQLFAPAAERQAELRQQWGFDCSCSRCKAEARYANATSSSTSSTSSSSSSSSTLCEQLQAAYARCQELSPQLDAAVESEDLAAVRGVQRELLAMQEGLEGCLRAAKPPANVRRWLQASVYDLYDLLSLAADQLPPPPPKAAARGGRGGRGRGRGGSSRDAPAVETEALATCVRIVGELTPGSSAHVELATEYMVRTEARFGVDHQEAADAARLCVGAITTRYGPLSSSMLQLLVDTWAGSALL